MNRLNKIRDIYTQMELSDQLYTIFFAVSAVLSVIGLILGLAFGVAFWLNIPHIITMLMCIVLPLLLRKSIKETTERIMLFGAVFYIPFVYFTNGGYKGAGPIYLVMIIVFYAFHFEDRRLLLFVTGLNIYYVVLILFSYLNPAWVVPYPDETSRLIDLMVAVVSVSVVLVIVSYASYNGFKRERKSVYKLMDELTIQNSALEAMSIRDQLTGVFTRRYFIEKLEEELAFAEEDQVTFYVLMADIDYFKKVNDTYGHPFGDEVLKEVARVLRENIRSFDIVARYGGEEFILLLTHSEGDQGEAIAERIRSRIEGLSFREDVKVTVSIGVAVNKAEDTTETIIQRADSLLYQAKNSGRNRVCR